MLATIPDTAIRTAAGHVSDLLEHALEHTSAQRALIVADADCELSRALTAAYRQSLPDARFVEFDAAAPDAIRPVLEEYGPEDLVILIQSTSFRLHAFRIRLELFRRGLKVVEHPHLERMPGPEALIYLESLAYDPEYYRGTGHALKSRLDKATAGTLESGEARLHYPAGFEPAKLNIGDYSALPNCGGQFPIGEVFTESTELTAVHGTVRISHFGDTAFRVNQPLTPITLVVEGGRVVETQDSTPEFDAVLALIREGEGGVWLRELGFGLNRAFSPSRVVSDIGTFERMCGVHLSLGSKHATYNKSEIRKKAARYHVDVFAATSAVLLDGESLFSDGAWTV